MFIRVFFAAGLLTFVGLGLWFLLAPPGEPEVTTGEVLERAERAGAESEQVRDSLRRQLVLSRYDLERAPAIVSGTVVNNTDYPFVNVQVGFRLYDADSTRIGTVRDTAPIVEAGDVWNFSISLPPEQTAARAENYELQGEPKAPLDPNARTGGTGGTPGAPPQNGAGQQP